MNDTTAPLPSAGPAWQELSSHAEILLRGLQDGSDVRLGEVSGGRLKATDKELDSSRVVMTPESSRLLLELARERHLEARRGALLQGELVNRSERRPALHPLLRDLDGKVCSGVDASLRKGVEETRRHMQSMAQRLHSGDLRGSTGAPITDIVNIGIGGSEFGTRLLCDALQDLAPPGRRIHFVSSVDALEVARLTRHVDPASTLFIVSSKSFSTVETLLNARTLRAWFDERRLDAAHHWFAVTGKSAAAEAFGIPAANILDVPDWVGGRFSPWGAVGLPAALYLGWPVFERWLQGGQAADLHFVRAPLDSNVPVRLALDNVWSSTLLQCASRCVVAYDGRLAQFLPWLQQVEMESNGKSVTEDGLPVSYATSPVVWGGLGNNGQHTYFQLLREGTGPKAITVIGTKTASSGYPEHAAELDAHRRAQVTALSQGSSAGSFNSVLEVMLDDLGPSQLGALMATFEHATACSGWLGGINSFDQPGVEFGKQIARQLRAGTG